MSRLDFALLSSWGLTVINSQQKCPECESETVFILNAAASEPRQFSGEQSHTIKLPDVNDSPIL